MSGTGRIGLQQRVSDSSPPNEGKASKARAKSTGSSSSGAEASLRKEVNASAPAAVTQGEQEVRSDKVHQLRAAIAGGGYRVSSADLADKLLEKLLSE